MATFYGVSCIFGIVEEKPVKDIPHGWTLVKVCMEKDQFAQALITDGKAYETYVIDGNWSIGHRYKTASSERK